MFELLLLYIASSVPGELPRRLYLRHPEVLMLLLILLYTNAFPNARVVRKHPF